MKQLFSNAKTLVLALIAIVATNATAQEESKLVIYNHDGEAPVEIVIDDIHKITFQDEHFTMVYIDNFKPSEQYLYDDVRAIKFSGLITGIGSVENEDGVSAISISREGDNINVSGITKPAHLTLYDISGRPVMNNTITSDTQISTETLTSGVYILRVNNKTFKFSKF